MEYRPQPGPQEKFLSTSADIAIYGGAAGGGKTFSVLFEALRYVKHKKFRAIGFRRNTEQIRTPGGLWDESVAIYPGAGGKPIESRLSWIFPSGARIKFSHIEYEKDIQSYHGAQIPYIFFDELTQFTEKQFWYLVTRNRSAHGIPCYVRASCNPDPDSFVRNLIDWWIDKSGIAIPERSGMIRWFIRMDDKIIWGNSKQDLIDEHWTPENPVQPLSLTFIPAKLDDNQILLKKDPGYKARLMAQSKIDRERLLGANWNIKSSAGIYFKKHYFELVDAHPRLVKVVRAWDRAATEWKEGDPGDPDATASVKIGMDANKQFYILDVTNDKLSPLKVEQMILNYAKLDGVVCTVKLFQDPGSAGKGEADHMKKVLRGFKIDVDKITESKEVSAKAMSAQAEFGNVKILRSCRNIDSFLTQMEGFPDLKKKDMVDAATSAFNFLNLDNTGEFTENMIQKGESIIGADLNSGDQW